MHVFIALLGFLVSHAMTEAAAGEPEAIASTPAGQGMRYRGIDELLSKFEAEAEGR